MRSIILLALFALVISSSTAQVTNGLLYYIDVFNADAPLISITTDQQTNFPISVEEYTIDGSTKTFVGNERDLSVTANSIAGVTYSAIVTLSTFGFSADYVSSDVGTDCTVLIQYDGADNSMNLNLDLYGDLHYSISQPDALGLVFNMAVTGTLGFVVKFYSYESPEDYCKLSFIGSDTFGYYFPFVFLYADDPLEQVGQGCDTTSLIALEMIITALDGPATLGIANFGIYGPLPTPSPTPGFSSAKSPSKSPIRQSSSSTPIRNSPSATRTPQRDNSSSSNSFSFSTESSRSSADSTRSSRSSRSSNNNSSSNAVSLISSSSFLIVLLSAIFVILL